MALSQPTKPQAQAAMRRKLLAAARLAKPALARNGRALPRAWFMTDPKRTPHPERVIERLPSGFGVIYRHFGAKDRFEAGKRLARICRQRRLLFLVSADPQLAQRIGADGVHWPEADLKGVRSRQLRWIETASAHSPTAIAAARRYGIDAVVLSAVFPSISPSAATSMGALRFRLLIRQTRMPVYALGGITAANASRAMTHAAGWAAVEAVMAGWSD